MASLQTDSAAPDALFVVNRLTDESRLAALCQKHTHRQVLILSTHRPFPSERAALVARLAPAHVHFLSFADVLDDDAMVAIDEETTRELLARNEEPAGYVRAFQALMTFRKNSVVHLLLPGATPSIKLYADAGLGVSWPYWRQKGATPLCPHPLLAQWRNHPWMTCWSRWRHKHRVPKTATLLVDGRMRYLIAGGARRLPLQTGATPEPAILNRTSAARADFVAATVHDYWPAIHRFDRPVRIFADGYLPSNYPRSYLDSYGPAEFVAADPFSAQWLKRHGRTVVPTPGFIAPPVWSLLATMPCIRTIVCLLNHAGDWSALVNRSDTDALVATVIELAATSPEIEFVVRPHPGMEHGDHEGAGGIPRLARVLEQSGLRNLSCSTGPLAADLDRGDLFVSEYSATLLDAWRIGKPGVIINVTGRRSFMDDFARLGFPQVEDATGLSAILDSIRAEPGEFLRQHNAAVVCYNEKVHMHLAQ